MIALRSRSFSWLVCLTLLAGTRAWAQTTAPQKPYEPVVGQEGRDAVWVPTSSAMVEKMLDHAKVTPQDFVIDLGSGDGRMVIAAARRGARALGVEFNPDLVEYSKREAAAAGVADKAIFTQGDMYQADISKATVLALFLLPANLEKLAPKFLDLPPGTRIVANTFWVAGWTPDDTVRVEEGCENWCTSHLFIIPANVQGRWRVDDGELSVTQHYQMIEGTYIPRGGTPRPVKGRLRGSVITLTVGEREYEGRVTGNTIAGAEKGASNSATITATRIE